MFFLYYVNHVYDENVPRIYEMYVTLTISAHRSLGYITIVYVQVTSVYKPVFV